MSKPSPWFEADTKPEEDGYYETDFGCGDGFSYWNGHRWSNQVNSLEESRLTFTDAIQAKRWRKIVEEGQP